MITKWVIIALILIWIVILVVVLAIWKPGMNHPPGRHSRYRISPELPGGGSPITTQ